MGTPMCGSAAVTMNAPPAVVWSLISDVTRIGEYSPETFEAEWLDGATGPAPGARFRGHVRRNGVGPVYWTPCIVLECKPEEEFAFAVGTDPGRPLNTWRYQLKPSAGGTEVTESFELTPAWWVRLHWIVLGRRRRNYNIRQMRQTLDRIRVVAERTAAAG